MVTQSEIINKNFKQLQEENKVNTGYLTGQVSTEKKMFEQVRAMKTSTFDISKFITSGALTITEDGIASGFSFSPKILTKTAPVIDLSKPFRIELECKELTKNLGVFFSFGPDRKNYLYYRYNMIKLTLAEINLTAQQNLTVDYASIGKTVLTWDGSTYRAYVYKKDGTEYCNLSIASTTALTNSQIIIGESDWEGLGLTGSIDLKTVSIVSDGVEVFNGNKTGIDQIKKDDYTVVGSPVISADGVASGFSSGNYLNTNKSLDYNNSFLVKFKAKLIEDIPDGERFYFIGSYPTGGDIITIELNKTGIVKWTVFTNNNGTKEQILKSIQTKIPSIGDKYDFEIGYKDGKFYFQCYINEILYKDEQVSSLPIYSKSSMLIIGNYHPTYAKPNKASIDLNSFKVYVDDNLVYQPTLRIPYTQSKTGSKIVDSVYRDRVQDVYEQFGQANYYTLLDGEKYNVSIVGSTTLVDGVASGFSTSDYLSIPNTNIKDSSNWSIEFIANLTNDDSASGGLISISSGNGITLNSARSSTNYQLELYLGSASTGWDIVNRYILVLDEITEIGQYLITLSYKNEVYRLSAKNINTGIIKNYEEPSSLKIYQDPTQIGCRRLTSASKGSIDLNSFKIYVDGKEVFRGYDKPNITLPMGEIYGMIENKLDNSDLQEVYPVIKTFVDGTSGYRIWSDGYCEQWGYYSGVGAVVTFLKKFANTNYIVTNSINTTSTASWSYSGISHTDKTVSSVKFPNQGGAVNSNWKVSGYLAEGEY